MIGAGLGGAIRVADYSAAVRQVFAVISAGVSDTIAITLALERESRLASALGDLAAGIVDTEAMAWQRSHASCPWCGETAGVARP